MISVQGGARGGAYAAIVFELVPEAQVKQAGRHQHHRATRCDTHRADNHRARREKDSGSTGFRVRSASEDQLLASLYGRNAVMLSAEATTMETRTVFTGNHYPEMLTVVVSGRFPLAGDVGLSCRALLSR